MVTRSNPGVFVPTTYIWDVSQVYDVDVTSPEFKELLVRLYQNINNITLALNLKDTGIYDVVQTVNGQTFFPNPALNSSTSQPPTPRQAQRLLVVCGALPNATTKSVPHGITCTSLTTFTRTYGEASDTTGLTYIPLPYPSLTLNNVIEVSVDATNVHITTGSNRSNYNVSYVILEYLQS